MSNTISSDLVSQYVSTPAPVASSAPPATSDGSATAAEAVGATETTSPAAAATTVQTPAASAAKPSDEALHAAVSQLQSAVESTQNAISFNIDRQTGATIVRVTDSNTGQLIRQIPSEETLAIAQNITRELSLMQPDKA